MMGKLTGLCVLLLVLNIAVTEDTVTTVYFTDGGDLTLKVRPAFPGHINIIEWKFNGILLADWVEDEGYYFRIKRRATLTKETGQLIMKKMKKDDEGVYSVGINDRVQSESYNAILIKKVQKPKVVVRTVTFEAEYKRCKLSCDSNTTEAEPVSYSWKKGAVEVSGKYINITNFSVVKTFTCRIENPVSREESDPEPNPLYKEDECSIFVAAVVGALVGGLSVVGLLVACKKEKGLWWQFLLKQDTNQGNNLSLSEFNKKAYINN